MDEVPPVAVEVEEHDHATIRFVPGRFDEPDTAGLHVLVVAREVVGVQEQEHPAAGLVAHGGELFLSLIHI